MRSITRRLFYELRLSFGMTLWSPLGVAAMIGLTLADTPAPRLASESWRLLELLLPPTAGLVMPEALGREFLEKAAGWRASLPGGLRSLLIWRLGTAGFLWTAMALVGGLALVVGGLLPGPVATAFHTWTLLLGPPSLFLGALGAAGTLAARDPLGGVAAALGFWILDLMTAGLITAPFHVAYLRAPLSTFTLEETRRWLTAGAALLLTAILAFGTRGERWLR